MGETQIIDLMAALKKSINQMCKCGHRFGEHRGAIPKCAQRDCDCRAFAPTEEQERRAPESEEGGDD